jgi:hypothetical protein
MGETTIVLDKEHIESQHAQQLHELLTNGAASMNAAFHMETEENTKGILDASWLDMEKSDKGEVLVSM